VGFFLTSWARFEHLRCATDTVTEGDESKRIVSKGPQVELFRRDCELGGQLSAEGQPVNVCWLGEWPGMEPLLCFAEVDALAQALPVLSPCARLAAVLMTRLVAYRVGVVCENQEERDIIFWNLSQGFYSAQPRSVDVGWPPRG